MCLCEGDGPVAAPKIMYRKDYKKPAFAVPEIFLDFQLDADCTVVRSRLRVKKNPEADWAQKEAQPLLLDGEDIELVSVTLNGKKLEPTKDYVSDTKAHLLTIASDCVPQSEEFTLEIVNNQCPRKNTALQGLYLSSGILCTQCESEGFRRITYFPGDRPDVMATYTVRLEADKTLYPILLSNGNVVKDEPDLPNGRHAATFCDYYPKPTYLFAIIAGPLKSVEGVFTRETGKDVKLIVYAEEGLVKSKSLDWALHCLQLSMKWDEEKFGRVYDDKLDTLRMVSLHDFNMGAMENKSLLTFKANMLIAGKDVATDSQHMVVASCVAHEYAHNWSGNRVTVRDWFQVTLKEGFTKFRDRMFSEDHFSRATVRIGNVSDLRNLQFPEDASTMAHSIRIEQARSTSNFYSSTIYLKGSEVIRMYRCLFGNAGFRKGTDLYFDTYDGQAVSCDEFRHSMAEANSTPEAKVDLTQFERWYLQKGTPRLEVLEKTYCPESKTFKLKLKQHLPVNAGPEDKPFHFPVTIGLIGKSSHKDLLPTSHDLLKHTHVLEMRKEVEEIVFNEIGEDCVLSILRDFSAPLIVLPHQTDEELAFIMAHDSDPFNTWDAAQQVMQKIIIDRACGMVDGKLPAKLDASNAPPLPQSIIDGVETALKNRMNDNGFVAQMLALPSTTALLPFMKPFADPLALHHAANSLRQQIALQFQPQFAALFDALYKESQSKPYDVEKESIARRKLQNTCLQYLLQADASKAEFVLSYAKKADSWNDRLTGYKILLDGTADKDIRRAAREGLYEATGDLASKRDMWFSSIAGGQHTTMDEVRELTELPEFKGSTNPDRFRCVVAVVPSNTLLFHDPSGEGYMWIAEKLVAFDKLNPTVTCRLAKALVTFDKYSPERQAQMLKAVKYMNNHPLSPATGEVVASALKA